MKNKPVPLASLALALTMLFASPGSATASDKGSKDCKTPSKSDCKKSDDKSGGAGKDSKGDCNQVLPTVQITSPFDGFFSGDSIVSVTVKYTAPKNSGAKISLIQDGVVVGVFTVPCNTTAGQVTFGATLTVLSSPSVFQAQLCTVSDSSGGDDRNGDAKRTSGDDGKRTCGDGKRTCGDGKRTSGDDNEDDDDDESGCPGKTKCIVSNIVSVYLGEVQPL